MGRLLRHGADAVGALWFVTMLGAFLVQVFARYVLNRPFAWSEEVSLIAYIWGIFWAAAFMVPEREHVTFDLLYLALPAPARRAGAIVGTALTGALFLLALPATWDYVRFMERERTWVLGIRFDLVFACFLLFAAAVVVRAAGRLRRLLGRDAAAEL